jgi:sugar lactone lactonase YvrE
MGIAAHDDGTLYLADTFNQRLKRLDPKRHTVETCFADAVALREPEGLAVAGDHLFVADTGQHRVVVVDLVTGRVGVLLG